MKESRFQLDMTPIHPTLIQQLEYTSEGDVERLSGLYASDSLVVLNSAMKRAVKSGTAVAKGGKEISALNRNDGCADVSVGNLWEFVARDDLYVARYSLNVNGVEKSAFSYTVLRDGKIWRQVQGIEDESTKLGGAAMDVSSAHPVFQELVKNLAQGDIEGLLKLYDKNAVHVMTANKARGFRARGSVKGHDELRDFLTEYVGAGAEMVELKEYIDAGDLVYVNSVMKQGPVVDESHGIFVFSDDAVVAGASSC